MRLWKEYARGRERTRKRPIRCDGCLLSSPTSCFPFALLLLRLSSFSPLSSSPLSLCPRRSSHARDFIFELKQPKTPPPLPPFHLVGNAAGKVKDLITATATGVVDGGKAVVGKAGDAAKAVASAADSALSKITKDDKKKIAIAGGVVLAVAGGVLAWQNAPEADKEKVRAKGRETKAWIKKTDASAKKSVNDAAKKVKDRAEADTQKTKQALKDAESAAKKKADEVAARARAEADKLRGKVDKKADKTAKAVGNAEGKGKDFLASVKAIFGQ